MIVNLLAESIDDTCLTSTSHMFKIRHLLAMGKVVVSEVCLYILDIVKLLAVLCANSI